MASRDWSIPLLAGAVAFAVFWFVPVGQDGDGGEHVQDDGGFTYAFDAAPRVPSNDRPATMVLLSRDPQAVGVFGNTHWQTPHLALQASLPFDVDCMATFPCGWAHDLATPDEPRLFEAGYNATNVTIHIFNEDGFLIASNAPMEERLRFLDGANAMDVPAGTWYLGRQSPPPNGTMAPPQFAAPLINALRGNLTGLPEGGVAAIRSNAMVNVFGTLYPTVRVDDLVHAP